MIIIITQIGRTFVYDAAISGTELTEKLVDQSSTILKPYFNLLSLPNQIKAKSKKHMLSRIVRKNDFKRTNYCYSCSKQETLD